MRVFCQPSASVCLFMRSACVLLLSPCLFCACCVSAADQPMFVCECCVCLVLSPCLCVRAACVYVCVLLLSPCECVIVSTGSTHASVSLSVPAQPMRVCPCGVCVCVLWPAQPMRVCHCQYRLSPCGEWRGLRDCWLRSAQSAGFRVKILTVTHT